ncbi:MAG: PdaC/SigV domain-containing protein [Aureispira sp.]
MNQLFIPSNVRVGVVAIFLSTSLVWGACSPPLEKKAFVHSEPVVMGPYQLHTGEDTLSYTLYEQVAHEHNPDEYSQSDSTTIRFRYPLLDSSAPIVVRDKINAHIQAMLLEETTQYETVEERLEGFITEFRLHKKDMQDFGLPSSNWAFDMQLSVLTNTPEIFALQVDQLEFTGGAHANSWTSYKNYHTRSGKELQLEDLFYEHSQEAWLPLARAAFWKAWETQQDNSLEKTTVERDTADFVLPPNFSIGTESLYFYYNPYELEAYALTELSFFLPYTELLPFVDTTVLSLEAQPMIR